MKIITAEVVKKQLGYCW